MKPPAVVVYHSEPKGFRIVGSNRAVYAGHRYAFESPSARYNITNPRWVRLGKVQGGAIVNCSKCGAEVPLAEMLSAVAKVQQAKGAAARWGKLTVQERGAVMVKVRAGRLAKKQKGQVQS